MTLSSLQARAIELLIQRCNDFRVVLLKATDDPTAHQRVLSSLANGSWELRQAFPDNEIIDLELRTLDSLIRYFADNRHEYLYVLVEAWEAANELLDQVSKHVGPRQAFGQPDAIYATLVKCVNDCVSTLSENTFERGDGQYARLFLVHAARLTDELTQSFGDASKVAGILKPMEEALVALEWASDEATEKALAQMRTVASLA